MIRALLCWLGVHRPQPGVSTLIGVGFECRDCGAIHINRVREKR